MWRYRFHGILLFLLFALFSAVAQSPLGEASSQQANREAALRYLALGSEYVAKGDWDNAARAVDAGLSYDETISDLWYLRALWAQKQGMIPAGIIPLFQTAFDKENWLDYHRDDARLLYAGLLSVTGESERALELLDAGAALQSREADYIRASALYCTGNGQDRFQARDIIAAAQKIYPKDERFLRLFFINEMINGFDSVPETRSFAAPFVSALFASDSADAELIIHSAAYAETEERVRILRSFNGRGLRHPLYALFALEEGLLNQADAWEYFKGEITQNSEKEVPLSLLEVFGGRLTEEETIGAFRDFLVDFAGILGIDTGKDGITDLRAEYMFGRPSRVTYDKNQDGIPDWIVECGFGTPQEAVLTGKNLRIIYGDYPFLARIESGAPEAEGAPENPAALVVYEYPPAVLEWSPVEIALSADLFNAPGSYEFFIPRPAENQAAPRDAPLFAAASRIASVIPGRDNEKILFTVLDGITQAAEYYRDEILYARLIFENGMPKKRLVDETGDSRFNLTEEYLFDPAASASFQSAEEEAELYRSLFGAVTVSRGLYRSKISIDKDGDTVPDYIEEYTGKGGKTSRWDFTADGDWAVSHIRYPSQALLPFMESADDIIEDTLIKYRQSLITVRSQNNVPVQLSKNDTVYPVQKAVNRDFYWIGEKQDDSIAALVADVLSRQGGNTVQIVESEAGRIFAVRSGPYMFGELLNENE
ncbi:MAG: hypothetical protein LBS97_06850 [Treponema sp.]|jgi:hypothetical protein|nr:hypothetical protein [Treponema sp.]